jgi:serine/threonine protein phosphatase PrpC
MWNLDIAARCDIGCVRKNNEDMILVSSYMIRDESLHVEVHVGDEDRYIVAVADGMGGHSGGEIASEEVLKSLDKLFDSLPKHLDAVAFKDRLFAWLEKINNLFNFQGKERKELKKMGTTLVGLILYEKKAFWINSGDSRLYRFHNGELKQITYDHSLDNFTGNVESPNVIVNCIGGGCLTSYLDIEDFTNEIMPGDVLVVCSDGLYRMLSKKDMEYVLTASGSAEHLCDAAVAQGGIDNISVCTIKIK